MLEAPGVEGAGEQRGFDGLRDGSCRKGADSAGLAAGGENGSEVSDGFVEVRCSGVVDGAGEGDDPPVSGAANAPDALANAAEDAIAAASGAKALQARLLALEHVLEAVGALLAVGDVQYALNLIRGWRGRG